jgi:OFA family oxalate/formate antiporter-like MFS transporter
MYTAKGTAAALVPLASVLVDVKGNWHAAFIIAAAMNIIAALMAILVLKPMRGAYTSRLGSGSIDAAAKLATH